MSDIPHFQLDQLEDEALCSSYYEHGFVLVDDALQLCEHLAYLEGRKQLPGRDSDSGGRSSRR